MSGAGLTEAQADLIYEAMRFFVWAVGEGISPSEGDLAGSPDDTLVRYSVATDDTDWEGLPERIRAALSQATGGGG